MALKTPHLNNHSSSSDIPPFAEMLRHQACCVLGALPSHQHDEDDGGGGCQVKAEEIIFRCRFLWSLCHKCFSSCSKKGECACFMKFRGQLQSSYILHRKMKQDSSSFFLFHNVLLQLVMWVHSITQQIHTELL